MVLLGVLGNILKLGLTPPVSGKCGGICGLDRGVGVLGLTSPKGRVNTCT
jgi:hypothetical protein